MKKLASILAVLILCLTQAAMAVTPSITLSAITAPEIVEVIIIHRAHAGRKPIAIAPLDAEKNEASQSFVQRAAEQLHQLAERKAGNPDAFLYDFFANARVSTRAAACAGIAADGQVTTAIETTSIEQERVIEGIKMVKTPAVTLEQLVSALFGANAHPVVQEFTTLAVEGYDAAVHEEITVKMTFTADCEQERMLVLLGSFDADGAPRWIALACDVENGAVVLTLDGQTMQFLPEGRMMLCVLSAAG